MLTSTVNLLQTLCLSAGVHAEVMQSEAVKTLCGLLRMLVESGTTDKTCMQWTVVDHRVRSGLWICHVFVCVCVHVGVLCGWVCQCHRAAAVTNYHRHDVLGCLSCHIKVPQSGSLSNRIYFFTVLEARSSR